MRRAIMTTGLVTALCAGSAVAGDEVIWAFGGFTEGEEVHWVSEDAADPTADFYEIDWFIETVEITVSWTIFDFVVDVLDQIPPEGQMGSGVIDGPLPVVIFEQSVQFPEPPADPGLAAMLAFGIQADGFGYFDATDLVLGEIEIDLGVPFGVQTVQVEAILVEGLAFVNPRRLGDANDDGVVDFDDLLDVLSAWGPCPDPPASCGGDFDHDGMVGFSDLLLVLGNWS